MTRLRLKDPTETGPTVHWWIMGEGALVEENIVIVISVGENRGTV